MVTALLRASQTISFDNFKEQVSSRFKANERENKKLIGRLISEQYQNNAERLKILKESLSRAKLNPLKQDDEIKYARRFFEHLRNEGTGDFETAIALYFFAHIYHPKNEQLVELDYSVFGKGNMFNDISERPVRYSNLLTTTFGEFFKPHLKSHFFKYVTSLIIATIGTLVVWQISSSQMSDKEFVDRFEAEKIILVAAYEGEYDHDQDALERFAILFDLIARKYGISLERIELTARQYLQKEAVPLSILPDKMKEWADVIAELKLRLEQIPESYKEIIYLKNEALRYYDDSNFEAAGHAIETALQLHNATFVEERAEFFVILAKSKFAELKYFEAAIAMKQASYELESFNGESYLRNIWDYRGEAEELFWYSSFVDNGFEAYGALVDLRYENLELFERFPEYFDSFDLVHERLKLASDLVFLQNFKLNLDLLTDSMGILSDLKLEVMNNPDYEPLRLFYMQRLAANYYHLARATADYDYYLEAIEIQSKLVAQYYASEGKSLDWGRQVFNLAETQMHYAEATENSDM